MGEQLNCCRWLEVPIADTIYYTQLISSAAFVIIMVDERIGRITTIKLQIHSLYGVSRDISFSGSPGPANPLRVLY